jgi:hypothetical protein
LTEEPSKILCENCGASALDEKGKCAKCRTQATLKAYGSHFRKTRSGNYLLMKKDSVDPLASIHGFYEVTKKNVQKITGAPLEVIEATFAALELQEEREAEEAEENKNGTKTELKVDLKKYDVETEAKIGAALQKVLDADNQLEALSLHLDNMIIGEDNTKKVVVVLLLSGKCKDELKQIILFKATEGAGKSTIMRIASKGYKVKDVGRFSSHALDYTDLEGYEILILKELGVMDDETQGVSTLKFLSCDDNGYTVEVTVKDKETDSFKTVQRRIPPITTISSTTRLQLDPQFERRAWLNGLDESEEQTKRIAGWIAKNELQKAEKILGKRKLTDDEFSSEVYSRFIQQFKPIDIIIPFPQTLLNTLGFNVLRVRGDLGKLLTFAKLYANLNRKRLEKVTDSIYTLTPDVAVEALNLALQPISSMLAKIDNRAKCLFAALKKIKEIETDFDKHETLIEFHKKGSEINKHIREKVAVEIGKSERTVRSFLAQLCTSGYVSDDGKKPKTFTLLYDVEEIEKRTSGLMEKTLSADFLKKEMQKEAQEWIKTSLENLSLAESKLSVSVSEKEVPNDNDLTLPSTEEKISNTVLANSQTDSANQDLDNWRNTKLPIKQGDNKKEPDFYFEKVKPSEKCDCGEHSVGFKITIMSGPLKGGVLPRCESCFLSLRREFHNSIWKDKSEVEQRD